MKNKIVYESNVEINPMTDFYSENELFNGGFFDKVKYLRTKIINGEHYL